jgi:hypothetical protein
MTPNLSTLTRWCHDKKSTYGLVCHVTDLKIWAHIDSSWLDFATKLHNVMLGLALDGVNPYGNQSTNWSTWLIFLRNYNLPPWLTTKKFYLILALLIPRNKSMKKTNIDVYMAPLIQELQKLWKGVLALDLAEPYAVSQSFSL